MQNLAGVASADDYIHRELTRCGIKIVSDVQSGHEVNARLTGRIGAVTLTRAWAYWVATGPVPLDVAQRLYATPVGATDIRAGGHCGCVAPETQATHFDADGRRLVHDPEGKEERGVRELVAKYPGWPVLSPAALARMRFVPDAAAAASRSVVETFHIDSGLGLYLFAEAVRALPSD